MSASLLPALGEIMDVKANSAWANEVTFSAWLATNLGRLTNVLDVGDLELVGTELSVGEFRCDIVARESGSGRIMVIENQFSRTDHDHLGKLMTYAAQHSAEIVVWISPEIRDEHRAAIDWLNKITSERIGFFAVQLRVITINDSLPAPLLELRASPNVWVKPMSAPPSVPSPRNELYRQFFQALIDDLRGLKFTNAKVALPRSWYDFSTGQTGFKYTVTFGAKNRLRVGLYIVTGNRDANKAAYDNLFEKKTKLEAAFKAPLDWQRLDHRSSCRISIVRPDSSIDQVSPQPDEARKWLVEQLLAFKAAFGPIIPFARSTAESTFSEPEAETTPSEPELAAMNED